jgi:hypothetical protein
MFRTSGCLAIALTIAAIGSAITPASASSSQYLGGAYWPQVVPPPRPFRCGLTNCLGPSGDRDVSAQSHPARVYTSPGTSRYRFPGKKKP